MGFEQLAALRDQLAAQNPKQDAQAQERRRPSDRPRRAGASSKARVNPPEASPRKSDASARISDPLLLAIARLQQHFPRAFPKKPANKVPLKIGIYQDLTAHAQTLRLDQPQIKAAIQAWCQGSRYWACLTLDAVRVDLNGEPAGTVTEADAKRARQLAGRQRWLARRKRRQTPTRHRPNPNPARHLPPLLPQGKTPWIPHPLRQAV